MATTTLAPPHRRSPPLTEVGRATRINRHRETNLVPHPTDLWSWASDDEQEDRSSSDQELDSSESSFSEGSSPQPLEADQLLGDVEVHDNAPDDGGEPFTPRPSTSSSGSPPPSPPPPPAGGPGGGGGIEIYLDNSGSDHVIIFTPRRQVLLQGTSTPTVTISPTAQRTMAAERRTSTSPAQQPRHLATTTTTTASTPQRTVVTPRTPATRPSKPNGMTICFAFFSFFFISIRRVR